MRYLENFSELINKSFMWIAICSLIATMVLAVGNMFLRAFFTPFEGTFELVGWLTAITTTFALAYTQMKRGHISIDFIVSSFNYRTQILIDAINSFAGMAIFALIAWQLFIIAARFQAVGSLSETMRIIYYPFTMAVAIGCAAVSLTLLVDFIKPFSKLFYKIKSYWYW